MIGRDEDRHARLRIEQGLALRALERSEASPRCRMNFERPQDALRIARLQLGGHFGIESGEFSMKFGGTEASYARTKFGAQSLRHMRNVRETLRERLEIKPGAADKDRQAAARLFERRRGILQIAPDRIIDRAVNMPEQKVRRASLLIWLRPGGQDREVAIDLHRIGIDERSAELFGEVQRKPRLAARRRACDEDCGDRLQSSP